MARDQFEQLSLLGDAPAPKPRIHRLFFALMPDAAAAARLHDWGQRLRERHGVRGRPIAPERLHITLHHLGDFGELPEMTLARARRAGDLLRWPAVAVHFDQVMSFGTSPGGRNPFVLGSSEAAQGEVTAFQRALAVCMAKEGLGREVERHFTPHMTLAYDPQLIALQAAAPMEWVAHELLLVHSLIGQSTYKMLGRWALGGQ